MNPKHNIKEAHRKIAERRRGRARKRNRTYTPEEQKLKAAYSRDYAHKYPERRKAWRAIHRATTRGKDWLNGDTSAGKHGGPIIVKPLRCRICDELFPDGDLRAHHFRGYRNDLERFCSVIWLCRRCHDQLHSSIRDRELINGNPDDVLRETLTETEVRVRNIGHGGTN